MPESTQPSLWWNRRALGLHATLAVTVPGFLALGWWQLHRALGGNGLSWAYTFEWPFFAGYAVYLWWKLVHEPVDGPVPETSAGRMSRVISRRAAKAGATGDDEAARAAYNTHLEALAAADAARQAPRKDDDTARPSN